MPLRSLSARAKQKLKKVKFYMTSTKKRQRISGIAMILVIAAAGQIVYSSFAATIEYSPIPQVAAMQKATQEVIARADEYSKMPDTVTSKANEAQPNALKATKKQELINKFNDRQKKYIIAMQYDPFVARKSALSQTTIKQLPKEIDVVKRVEKVVEIEGEWQRGHTHNKNDAPEREMAVVATKTAVTEVYAKNIPASKKSGTIVKARGIYLSGNLAVISDQEEQKINQASSSTVTKIKNKIANVSFFGKKVYAQASDQPQLIFCDDANNPQSPQCNNGTSGLKQAENIDITTLPAVVGSPRILIVPINFMDDKSSVANSSGAPVGISDLMKTYVGPDGFGNALENMSYGKLLPKPEVYPEWMTLNQSNIIQDNCDNSGSQTASMRQEVIDNLLAKGYKLGEYSNILLLFNNLRCSNGSISFGGYSYVNTYAEKSSYIRTSVALMAVEIVPADALKFAYDPQYSIKVALHEMSHSWGLNHAGVGCDKSCLDSAEYGDEYDYMGKSNRSAGHLNAFHKFQLGWLNEQEIEQVNYMRNKTVTIQQVAKKTTPALKNAVRIDVTDLVPDPYTNSQVATPEFRRKQLYLEYRSPADFLDNFTQPDGKGVINKQGVLVHEASFDGTYSSSGEPSSQVGVFPASTKLLNGPDYKQAALSQGEKYVYSVNSEQNTPKICIEVVSLTATSATINITFKCDQASLKADSTLGEYDSNGKFKGFGSYSPASLTSSATRLNDPYDSCRTGDKLFVSDKERIAIYELDKNGQVKTLDRERASGVISSSDPDKLAPGYESKGLMTNYLLTTIRAKWSLELPNGSLLTARNTLACDPDRQLLFVNSYYDAVGYTSKILVFDVSGELKPGMEPRYVLGQDKTVYDIPRPSSTSEDTLRQWQINRFHKQRTTNYSFNDSQTFRNLTTMYYSPKQKRLYVNDISYRRILVFDLAGQIINNMPARYVLGQTSFTSIPTGGNGTIFQNNVSLLNDWFGSIAFDEKSETLFTTTMFKASNNSESQISNKLYQVVAFDTKSIDNGEQPVAKTKLTNYYQDINPGSLVFDNTRNVLIHFGGAAVRQFSVNPDKSLNLVSTINSGGISVNKAVSDLAGRLYVNIKTSDGRPQINVYRGIPIPYQSMDGVKTAR